MLQCFLPSLAVCLDLFFTAIAYGMSGIRIPMRSALILSSTGAIFLFLSMELAHVTGLFLPERWCQYAGILLLSAMGGAMLLKSFVHAAPKQKEQPDFLTIYFDTETADADRSCMLSCKEAILLAAALSVDSLAVGVGLGWQKSSPISIGITTLFMGAIGVLCGTRIGMRLHKKWKHDCSWISGVLLLLLAFLHVTNLF